MKAHSLFRSELGSDTAPFGTKEGQTPFQMLIQVSKVASHKFTALDLGLSVPESGLFWTQGGGLFCNEERRDVVAWRQRGLVQSTWIY